MNTAERKAVVPDILGVVNRAVTSLAVEAPPLCFAPGAANTGAVGLTGMHAWAWICPPEIRDSTVGPMHRTAAAPGVAVTLTAFNTAVVVNWGDGSPPTHCAGALLPFVPYPDVVDAVPGGPTQGTASPSCGHLMSRSSLTEPDKLFHGSATSNWLVYWSAVAGPTTAAGVVPMPMTAQFAHRVGEVQVLANGGR